MSENFKAADGGHAAAPAPSPWADISADVRKDPQFNRKIDDANKIVREFINDFKLMDKDNNGNVSMTELKVAEQDPALAKDRQMIDFLEKSFHALSVLDDSDDHYSSLGISEYGMKRLPKTLDPNRAHIESLKDATLGAFTGALGGGMLGFLGGNVATFSEIASMGWVAVPIGTISAPALAAVTAVGAVGGAAWLTHTAYKLSTNYYNKERALIYPNL